MKITTSIKISAAELKAAAKGQDKIAESVRAVAGAFGKKLPKPSAWKQLRLALGQDISEEFIESNNGTKVTAKMTAGRKSGVSIELSINVNEKVVAMAFDMYADVLNQWAAVLVAAATGIAAANALSEQRIERFNKELSKLG